MFDAGDFVAREVNARGGTRRAVTEDHFLNVDGGAQAIGDAFQFTREDGAFVVPGTEDGFGGSHDLFFRILREFMAILGVDGFVLGDEFAQVVGGKVEVGLCAFFFFEFRERFFERIFAVFVFDLFDDVAVHLEQTTVAIEPETRLFARGECVDDFVGETDVQDGVHHAWHRVFGARTCGNEKGILRVAKRLPRNFFHFFEALHDFVLKGFFHVAVFEIVCMERRNVDDDRATDVEDAVHQIEAVAFATQQFFEFVFGDAFKFGEFYAFVEEISVFVLGSVKHVVHNSFRLLDDFCGRQKIKNSRRKAGDKLVKSADFVKQYRAIVAQ